MNFFVVYAYCKKKKKKSIIFYEIKTKELTKMKLQIIGMKKTPITSKKDGRQYYIIATTERNPEWTGICPSTQFLSDDIMRDLSIETENGEIYVADGKKYYFDADYNSRGRLVGGRIYNG